MKKIKVNIDIILVFLCCFLIFIYFLLFWEKNLESLAIEKKANENYTIGVSLLDMQNPYYNEVYRGITEMAAISEFKIIMQDAKSNVFLQKSIIEGYINDNVDAIIVSALSSNIIDPVLQEARKKGILVISQSTKVTNNDFYIECSDWNVGYSLGLNAADYIKNNLDNNATISILEYPRIPQLEDRVKGMEDALFESGINYNIVSKKIAATPEEGAFAAREIFKDNKNVNVILCINDGGALGVIPILEEYEVDSDKFYLGSVDATPSAIKELNKNEAFLKCTIDLSPYETGKYNVDFINRLSRGEKVETYYNIEPVVITKK